MKFKTLLLITTMLVLSACDFAAQSRYKYSEVGQIQNAEFGTVIGVRDIDIIAESSSSGGIIGGVAGGVGGAYLAGGGGSLVTLVAGAVIGANAFAALEQAVRNRGGVEYIVVLRNGKTITVAQNVVPKDIIHNINDRVLVQINGEYHRVLPANKLPTEIERPKGIKFKNE
jgi:outer membrane lipoprotein SlyB